MNEDVYQRLAKHLDNLPGGFPPTDSGVELRILRRLFTDEEAEVAVHLTILPEPARVVARRIGLPADAVTCVLEELVRKGLAVSLEEDGEHRYLAAQFVIGIWEYHVNDLDEGLIRDFNEYVPTLVDAEVWKKAPQLRTIPVQRSLTVHHSALPYDQAEELVRRAKLHLVAPCICRREHRMVGKGCDRPEESCLVFDLGADLYRRRGIGRVIGVEETLSILRQADEQGLVAQPSNSQKPLNICLCCGCCCQVLKALKRFPRPTDYVSSAYRAVQDQDACSGCEVCVARCQMGALAVSDGRVELNEANCIGCGLCVTACPTGALRLERAANVPPVPADFRMTLYNLGKARGKLSGARMVRMMLQSKLDRLMASAR